MASVKGVRCKGRVGLVLVSSIYSSSSLELERTLKRMVRRFEGMRWKERDDRQMSVEIRRLQSNPS